MKNRIIKTRKVIIYIIVLLIPLSLGMPNLAFAAPPTQLVQNLTFTDTDTNEGQIGGELTFEPALDETNIDTYDFYYLNSIGDIVGSSYGSVDANIGLPSYTLLIPLNTILPDGATQIGVFSSNSDGNSSTAATVPINDDNSHDPLGTIAPIVQGADVYSHSPMSVYLTFDENMIIADESGFSIEVNGVPATVLGTFQNAKNVVEIIIFQEIYGGDIVTVSYDAALGNAADEAGNLLESFAGLAVTNNLVADVEAPIITSTDIRNTAPNDIEVRFNESVLVTDGTGFTVTINGNPVVITEVTASGYSIILLTLDTTVGIGDVVLLSYNSAEGNATDKSPAMNPLESFTDLTITNSRSTNNPPIPINKTLSIDLGDAETQFSVNELATDADGDPLVISNFLYTPEISIVDKGTSDKIFITPVSEGTAYAYIWITDSEDEVIVQLAITVTDNPDESVTLSPGAINFDYSSFAMSIDSGGTIDFSLEENRPQVTISGSGISDIVIPSSEIQATGDNSIVTFDFPAGLEFGTYNIILDWNSGIHSGLQLPVGGFTFNVNHRYNGLHFKYNNVQTNRITKKETDSNFYIKAIATETGVSDVDVSSKVSWSVVSGSNIVSVNNNGLVSIIRDGSATISATYDGQTSEVDIVVSNVSTSSPAPAPSPSPRPSSSTSNHNSVEDQVEENVIEVITPEDYNENQEEQAIEAQIQENGMKLVEYEDKIEIEISSEIIEKALEALDEAFDMEDSESNSSKPGQGSNRSKIVINVPLTEENEKTTTKLPVDTIKSLNDKEVDLVIRSGNVVLDIPFGALDNSNVGSSGEVNLDINTLKNVSGDNSNNSSNGNKMHKLVDFKLMVKKDDGTSKEIKEFNRSLQIKVDVSDINPDKYEKLGVYYINEDKGILEFVGGKVNSNGEIVASTNHFSKYAVIEVENPFDDIGNHWAKEYIESMTAKNIINGCEDGSFKPDVKISRAQFIKMLVVALELELIEYNNTFTDVSKNDWYSKYVATAAAKGITTGIGHGKFNPNGELTRLEMAIMLSRAIGMDTLYYYEVYNEIMKFADSYDIPVWAHADVANVAKSKLITGSNGKFNPYGIASRAEAATVIYRLFNK